jgi:hypothetical protein
MAAFVAALAVVTAGGPASADVRVTNDWATTRAPHVGAPGYINQWNFAHPSPLITDDAAINECSWAHGRQNEPAIAIDPRNTNVVVGSSNDYCGTYDDGEDADGAPLPVGPIWLGYYRSENGGTSFQSSLVPGYPDDTSPNAALAQGVRTASAGDPVMAWDGEGRLFMGAESSDDPAGSLKTFGDVWVATFVNSGGGTINDGKAFQGSTIVARGSSAPNLLGKFNDKTALAADRTDSACRGNVYFSWSRFTGNGGVSIQFVRSTDHGRTFSSPKKLSASVHDVQFPDIAITGNGHVYVTFRQIEAQGQQGDAILYVKSTDCGATFSNPRLLTTFVHYDAEDVSAPTEVPGQRGLDDPVGGEEAEGEATPAAAARDCGDFENACASGYTFFRRDTQVRSAADQTDTEHEWVHFVYDPSKPGTETDTGTTYGSIESGVGSQSGVYYLRLNGATGGHTTPQLIDDEDVGHQLFPDISADAGSLHVIWWDSRNDSCYSPARPIGNCEGGTIEPTAIDAFASSATTATPTWSTPVKLSTVTSNPNYEQFGGRTVPFAGDYLWIDNVGARSYGVWTDWRKTLPGEDLREAEEPDADDSGPGTADVLQCRSVVDEVFTADTCPRAGGLDQDIYGALTP